MTPEEIEARKADPRLIVSLAEVDEMMAHLDAVELKIGTEIELYQLEAELADDMPEPRKSWLHRAVKARQAHRIIAGKVERRRRALERPPAPPIDLDTGAAKLAREQRLASEVAERRERLAAKKAAAHAQGLHVAQRRSVAQQFMRLCRSTLPTDQFETLWAAARTAAAALGPDQADAA